MFCHGADALGHPGIPLKVWTFKSSWGQEKWTVVLGLHRAAFTSNKAQEGEAGGGAQVFAISWILASVNSLIRVSPYYFCLKAFRFKWQIIEN